MLETHQWTWIGAARSDWAPKFASKRNISPQILDRSSQEWKCSLARRFEEESRFLTFTLGVAWGEKGRAWGLNSPRDSSCERAPFQSRKRGGKSQIGTFGEARLEDGTRKATALSSVWFGQKFGRNWKVDTVELLCVAKNQRSRRFGWV